MHIQQIIPVKGTLLLKNIKVIPLEITHSTWGWSTFNITNSLTYNALYGRRKFKHSNVTSAMTKSIQSKALRTYHVISLAEDLLLTLATKATKICLTF